jgi:hypothetical protein
VEQSSSSTGRGKRVVVPWIWSGGQEATRTAGACNAECTSKLERQSCIWSQRLLPIWEMQCRAIIAYVLCNFVAKACSIKFDLCLMNSHCTLSPYGSLQISCLFFFVLEIIWRPYFHFIWLKWNDTKDIIQFVKLKNQVWLLQKFI